MHFIILVLGTYHHRREEATQKARVNFASARPIGRYVSHALFCVFCWDRVVYR